MDFFVRRIAPPGRRPLLRYLSGVVVGVVAVMGLAARPAHATVITIDPTSLSKVGVNSGVTWTPTAVDAPSGGKMISYFNAGDWVEFPFTVPAGQGAVYTASGKYGTPNPVSGDLGAPVAISLDIRKAGTETHIGSEDIVLTPTGTDDYAYDPTAPFSGGTFDLAPGDYVLRMRNVSQLHTAISDRSKGYQWRGEISANAIRSVVVGPITLTSGAALPATGTITGKVTASDLGYGIAGAFVLANPTGKEIAEPSPFWYQGYWTMTDSAGNYTLTVPAGTSLTVQAGRPDSYPVAGVRAENVTVASGGTVTTNLSLKSRWSSVDGSGRLTVEEEYFFDKIPDPMPDVTTGEPLYTATNIDITADGNASNQIKLSWTGAGDYVDVYVDVPTGQAGLYDLYCTYMSFPGANIQFIANPGTGEESITQMDLVNSGHDENDPSKGYWMAATEKFPDPIRLHAGRNVVRELVVSGDANFDAFAVEKHVSDVPIPGEANPRNANFVWDIGEKEPGGTVAYPSKAGNTIEELYRGGYVEIPMVFDAPGIYKAVVNTKAWGPAPFVQLDLRPAGTDAHYATGDVAIPAVSSDYTATTINDIPVLQAGDYILRVRNATQFHTTVATRGDFNAYGANGFIPNRLDFGQTVFTKTGNLPAVGTLTGKVSATDIGGVAVGQAVVMANPTGAGVPEPSIIWQKGFWTSTDSTGDYTLPVVAGTYDVQAGQAAMYSYSGGLTPATVGGGATVTANVNLPSRVTQDTSGHYEINVETEYFTAKPKDAFGTGYAAAVIAFQENGSASNRLLLGYTDGGDFIDIPIDVPVGAEGQYTLTDYYFNGYWNHVDRPDGNVSFTANPDTFDVSTIQDVQPNTAPAGEDPSAGYNTPGVKVFSQPITLIAGHNLIRMKLESGSSNFDAFKLTSLATFPLRPSGTEALKVAAGLAAAPSPASGNEYKRLDTDNNGKIDMLDAVDLLKKGLR